MTPYVTSVGLKVVHKGKDFHIPRWTRVVRIKRDLVMNSYPELDYSADEPLNQVSELQMFPLVNQFTVNINGKEVFFVGGMSLVRDIYD